MSLQSGWIPVSRSLRFHYLAHLHTLTFICCCHTVLQCLWQFKAISLFILISSQPLNVMPEVGQCLFTGKAISPRQTTICRPAPSQQQCNLPTAQAGGKKRRQLFVTWLINWQHRVTRRSTIRGRQAALCKRMKDTLTAGEEIKAKHKPFQSNSAGKRNSCSLTEEMKASACCAEHIHVRFSRRWKWEFPKNLCWVCLRLGPGHLSQPLAAAWRHPLPGSNPLQFIYSTQL